MPVRETFKFMVLEIIKQIEDTFRYLQSPNEKLQVRIDERDDYIDSLNNTIQNICFSYEKNQSKEYLEYFKAIDTISRNLEKIGDYSVSIMDQMQYLTDLTILQNYNYNRFFKEIISSSKKINRAVSHKDLKTTLAICSCEKNTDQYYAEIFKMILNDLNKSQATGDLLTALLIFNYLERMGDALLNVGEAILSMIIGEKIKIHQFNSFRQILDHSDLSLDQRDLSFQAVTGTRSGCIINKVSEHGGRETKPKKSAQDIIFKDGNSRKIIKEKENLEKWDKIKPGLTPRVFGYNQSRKESSLLLEYLAGANYREFVLTATPARLTRSLELLKTEIRDIWLKTKKEEPVKLSMVEQVFDRVDDIYVVHPHFKSRNYQIGDIQIPSFEESLEAVKSFERELEAPFSVFIHGDFNLDNIIYDPKQQKIYFLDVYRSKEADYVQDISVFLISNFRIQTKETRAKRNLNTTIMEMFHFAQEFAESQNDNSFEIRLALGLVRSFITSTRFILNDRFAKNMLKRATYLLDQIISQKNEGELQNFRIPQEILIYK
jgi:phosphate uptake regulator/aminoglycoside phosphotransferase